MTPNSAGPAGEWSSTTRNVRVAIVGAGPHALTVATHLVELDPGLLDGDLVIIDPSGEWLHHWRRRMRAFDVAHLRSPVVHHPAPDPYALQEFARVRRRSRELHGRYQLPGTALFDDFCDEVIRRHGLHDPVLARAATRITHDGRVRLDDGTDLRAEHVVVTHGARQPVVPPWATGPNVVHADHVDLTSVVPGSRVVVVGGGITAAHLAIGAHARGASVQLVSHRRIREQEFDSDPGWLGPKFLAEFLACPDPAERAAAVRSARGGGSVPSWLHRRLSESATSRGFEMVVDDIVGWDGSRLSRRSGTTVADTVWCATGWRTDAAGDRLLGPLLECVGQSAVDGFVPLDHRLRIRSTVVHVTGPPASLMLGPSAGNLSGARRSGRRVAEAVFGPERAELLGMH
jgi:hypothetical protein